MENPENNQGNFKARVNEPPQNNDNLVKYSKSDVSEGIINSNNNKTSNNNNNAASNNNQHNNKNITNNNLKNDNFVFDEYIHSDNQIIKNFNSIKCKNQASNNENNNINDNQNEGGKKHNKKPSTNNNINQNNNNNYVVTKENKKVDPFYQKDLDFLAKAQKYFENNPEDENYHNDVSLSYKHFIIKIFFMAPSLKNNSN